MSHPLRLMVQLQSKGQWLGVFGLDQLLPAKACTVGRLLRREVRLLPGGGKEKDIFGSLKHISFCPMEMTYLRAQG
jgi:hypothetical protein